MNAEKTRLDIAKEHLWSQITKGYPRDPVTRRTTYVVDEHNAPALAELASYMVGAPCANLCGGAGIVLAGGVGTGKTDLMRALSRTITTGGGDGFEVASAVELVNRHDRSSRDERENGGARVILQYGNKTTDLCIDDLGEEPEGKHFGSSRDVVAEIVTLRYSLWKRSGILTHFTTNILTHEALLAKYGQRTTDRILEMARVLPLEGPSRRASSHPMHHERPVLFELPPPMPTPEEQEAERKRSDEGFRRIHELIESAAKEVDVKKEQAQPKRSEPLTLESDLTRYASVIMGKSRGELLKMRAELVKRYEHDEATSKPFLELLASELEVAEDEEGEADPVDSVSSDVI